MWSVALLAYTFSRPLQALWRTDWWYCEIAEICIWGNRIHREPASGFARLYSVECGNPYAGCRLSTTTRQSTILRESHFPFDVDVKTWFIRYARWTERAFIVIRRMPYWWLNSDCHYATKTADKTTKTNSPASLTNKEEESLIQWILALDQYGAAPRPSHVQDMANLLLSNRGPSNIQSIGKNWVYNFIKRHNELKTRFSKKKKKKKTIISMLNLRVQTSARTGLTMYK